METCGHRWKLDESRRLGAPFESWFSRRAFNQAVEIEGTQASNWSCFLGPSAGVRGSRRLQEDHNAKQAERRRQVPVRQSMFVCCSQRSPAVSCWIRAACHCSWLPVHRAKASLSAASVTYVSALKKDSMNAVRRAYCRVAMCYGCPRAGPGECMWWSQLVALPRQQWGRDG